MALTNVRNNSSRKLFWHEGPKQDRTIWNGKLNHALIQNDEPSKRTEPVQEFHPNGRRNHAYKPTPDAATKPAPVPDAWQQICQLHLKEWVTPGATRQASSGVRRGNCNRQVLA
jgi:hypothetical protein